MSLIQKKIWSRRLAGLALGSALAFGAVAAQAEMVLHRGTGGEPGTLDPHQASGTWENAVVGDLFHTSQMRRAAISVGSNIAEGFHRHYAKESLRFYNYSEGSLEELKYQLMIAKDFGYIDKGLYFIGTSGSTLDDMKKVLEKVNRGQLDTNVSVAAVCGLNCAAQGIRAVEKHLIPGKIVVYPQCRELELLTLDQLNHKLPKMEKQLDSGQWNTRAENELLNLYAQIPTRLKD